MLAIARSLCRLQLRATRVYSVAAPGVSGKSSPFLLFHPLPANACSKLRLTFTNYERHQGSHEGQPIARQVINAKAKVSLTQNKDTSTSTTLRVRVSPLVYKS